MQGFKRLFFMLLFFVGTLFISNAADAAEVYKQTTNLIDGPTMQGNKAMFEVGGNVKLIRHAKYLNSNFAQVDAVGGTKSSTRITAFAYNCPGYYTTRIYSDVQGTQLIGYIQVYISATDIKNTSCSPITPPPAPTPAAPKPTPPAPQPTHPVPTAKETFTPAPEPPQIYEDYVPEPPAPVPPSAPPVFPEVCTHSTVKSFNQIPGTDGTSSAHCCPATSDFQIFNINNTRAAGLDYFLEHEDEYYKQNGALVGNDWGCGVVHGDITETYCPPPQLYNASKKECVNVSVSGDTQGYPEERSEYEIEENGVSEMEYELYNASTSGGDEGEPVHVFDYIRIEACKLSESVYRISGYIPEDPDLDRHVVNPQPLTAPYNMNSTGWLRPGGENHDKLRLRLDTAETYSTQLHLTGKEPANWELYWQDEKNSADGKYTYVIESNKLTPNNLPSQMCPDAGEAPTTPADPDEPIEEPEINCKVDIWEEECLPSCYCPGLDAYVPGMGFMCCVWECPGLDAIIQDGKNFLMDDLVGTATPPPVPEFSAPDIPNIFDVLNNVDKRNQQPITTTEDPQLKDATFDANDLKMNAEEIPVRDDPTGGFDIKNPLDTLPQDGSTAPRPDSLNEKISYPQQSGGSGNINGNISYPQSNSGSVSTPSGGGSAKPPGYSEEVQYPGIGD